jgi:hypothetical protein
LTPQQLYFSSKTDVFVNFYRRMSEMALCLLFAASNHLVIFSAGL